MTKRVAGPLHISTDQLTT